MKTKNRQRITVMLSAIFLIVFALFASLATAVNASAAEVTSFDDTYVLDDLEGSTINGKQFTYLEYPQNDWGVPQVISFVEFGYSEKADLTDFFALYVYVYNPQQVEFDDTMRNQIQFTYGGKATYAKYGLKLLNCSEFKPYEHRFYKFKVDLSKTELQEIREGAGLNSRTYKVSGIELSIGGKVTEYKCLQEYTYKGYAKGFGDEEESTLTCEVNGVDKWLELDVHHTYYRPKGTNGKNYYTQDSLTSIYFAIPKDMVEEYGIMTRIRGQYLKALTSDIFVTGNEAYYKEFNSMLGKDVGYLIPDSGDFEALIGGIALEYYGLGLDIYSTTWMYNTPVDKGTDLSTLPDYEEFKKAAARAGCRYFSRLNYLFKAENGDADTYNVSHSDLQKYMEWYTKSGPGKNEKRIVDKYAASLFDWIDADMTYFDISSDDYTKPLYGEKITQGYWEKLRGTTKVTESKIYEGKEAIHEVLESEVYYAGTTKYLDVADTCDNLYIAEADIDEFRQFFDENHEDNVIYLVRFAVDDYYSSEAVEAHFDRYPNGFEETFNPEVNFLLKDEDTNCYLAQEYVYLDFDIIDITLTKNNVDTVMAVVMSPMDIIPGLSHPSVTRSDTDDWWKWIVALVALLVVVIILSATGILPLVVKGIVWVILLPFRLIGWTFKGIKQTVNKNKKE